MQRSAARKEYEKNELNQQRIIDDEHWVLDIQTSEHNEWVSFSGLKSLRNCEIRFTNRVVIK